jgi:hypothetical protein
MINTTINSAIKKFWRSDKASMTQVLLVSMMIPGIIALIVSTALTQLFIQYQDNRRTNMVSATEVASSYLLDDINTQLPTRFAEMSPAQLASETKRTIADLDADTYVSNFSVDNNGWINAVVVVDLVKSPGEPLSWGVQYRPTSATVFKGFDPTTKRPLWAFTDAASNPNSSLEPLGLYEQVPTVSSIDDYPTINRPGTKASAPLNLRVVRSAQFGTVLAWDKPKNAAEAVLTGYRVDSTKNSACFNKVPDTGADILADGYIVLDKSKDQNDYTKWTCSSTTPGNLVSVRGIGPAGTGTAAFINLATLPNYDLDNLVPPAPTNLSYVNIGGNNVLTWDEQSCKFGYGINFRISKVTQNNAAGNYGTTPKWEPYVAYEGKYGYVIPVNDFLQGSTQGWVVEAQCTNASFGASSASAKSNEATVTSPISKAPTLGAVTISGTTSGTAKWDAATCAPNTAPQYKATYTTKDGNPSTALIKDWATNYLTVPVTSALGTNAAIKVESRCMSTNGGKPVYSAISTSNSSPWLAGVPGPTGTAFINHDNRGTVTVGGLSCAVGSPRFLVTQIVRDGSNTNVVLANWGNAGAYSAYTTQGYTQNVTVRGRCDLNGATSTTYSNTASAVWTRMVEAPNWVQYPGLPSYRTVVWGASCSAGSPQYTYDVFIQGGAYHIRGGWDGRTSVNNNDFANRGWGAHGADVIARCVNNGVGSTQISGGFRG